MCSARLRRRVPSANALFPAQLRCHSLRFHKKSRDGSGKADAYATGSTRDVVWGVLWEIDEAEKPRLDKEEDLGRGYRQKQVRVVDPLGSTHTAFTYVAASDYIDPSLSPYSWYKSFILEGASRHSLPREYVAAVASMTENSDPDRKREARMLAVSG